MEKYPFFDPYSYINGTNSKNINSNQQNKNTEIQKESVDLEFKEDIFLEEQKVFNNLNFNISMKEYFETKYYYYRYLNEYLKYRENLNKSKNT